MSIDERAVRVWVLHDSGKTMREIAAETGIRISTVRAIILDIWEEGVGRFKARSGIL